MPLNMHLLKNMHLLVKLFHKIPSAFGHFQTAYMLYRLVFFLSTITAFFIVASCVSFKEFLLAGLASRLTLSAAHGRFDN